MGTVIWQWDKTQSCYANRQTLIWLLNGVFCLMSWRMPDSCQRRHTVSDGDVRVCLSYNSARRWLRAWKEHAQQWDRIEPKTHPEWNTSKQNVGMSTLWLLHSVTGVGGSRLVYSSKYFQCCTAESTSIVLLFFSDLKRMINAFLMCKIPNRTILVDSVRDI